MSHSWYYERDGRRGGPVNAAQLRQMAASGQLARTDLVWKQGLSSWKPAASIQGLFPVTTPDPPPLTPLRISRWRTPMGRFWVGSATLVLVVTAVAAITIWNGSDGSVPVGSSGTSAAHSSPPTNIPVPPIAEGIPQEAAAATTEEDDLKTEPSDPSTPDEPAPPVDASASTPPEDPIDPRREAGPEFAAPREPRRIELLDLQSELASAGFTGLNAFELDWFVRYGTAAAGTQAQSAGQFSRAEEQQRSEEHRRALAQKHFLIRNQLVSVPERNDFERRGLIINWFAPFRLMPFLKRIDPKDVRGRLGSVWQNQADPQDFWFLTKDKELRSCTWEQAGIVEQNDGVLYQSEGITSNLTMQFWADVELAKDIYQHPDHYPLDLVITNLRLVERNRLTYSARRLFFRRSVLMQRDWNCDDLLRCLDIGINGDPNMPDIFEAKLSGEQQFAYIEASLVSASLRSGSGELIGELRRYQDDELQLVEPPESYVMRVQATTFIGRPNLDAAAASGIFVRPGQTVRLRRRGEWRWGSKRGQVGADHLRVAIGEAGQPPRFTRSVPETLELAVEDSGELFFGVDDQAIQDNSGFLEVDVAIGDAPAGKTPTSQ